MSVYLQAPLLTSILDSNVDVILMAFLLRFNGDGGEPILNFANQGDKCTTFSGTSLFNCPEIAYVAPTS